MRLGSTAGPHAGAGNGKEICRKRGRARYFATWRYRRWLFWVCLPFFISMCVSTVYGRYHYIADVLSGIAVGALGFAAGSWLMERRGALAEIAE
jgi:membrane-associated phospholipid phosphatase